MAAGVFGTGTRIGLPRLQQNKLDCEIIDGDYVLDGSVEESSSLKFQSDSHVSLFCSVVNFIGLEFRANASRFGSLGMR